MDQTPLKYCDLQRNNMWNECDVG